MRKGRFSEEQIINVKEHRADIPIAELCRKHGIRGATLAALIEAAGAAALCTSSPAGCFRRTLQAGPF
jgi:hypothetical protein